MGRLDLALAAVVARAAPLMRLVALALLTLVVSAGATELDLAVRPDRATPQAQSTCESVVVRRCAKSAEAPPQESGGYRALQQRRNAPDLDQILEAVVIEGERLRRPPTVREAIEAATATRTARSFESGDGGQCTCIKPCPAWPAPCCSCTKGGRDAMINNLIR
jgi:hypothetical protein